MAATTRPVVREDPRDSGSSNLFSFFGINLPGLLGPKTLGESDTLTEIDRGAYRLYAASQSQLLFGFMTSEFVRIVPKHLFIYLNTEVGDFFGYRRALFNMAMRLYDDRGIIYVGEFICLKREEVLPYVRNNHSLITVVESELKKVGLGMNSKIVGWPAPGRGPMRMRFSLPVPTGA
jgi:hypothetical protein